MTNAVVLFRQCWNAYDIDTKKEFEVCKQYFKTFEYRTEIPANSLVIGRYSVLPYFTELEKELKLKKSRLINNYEEHSYIADLNQWYKDVKEFTPKTYEQWGDLKEGKWVVKGKTNSKKWQWNTHMFADGREQLLQVINRLLDDPLIREQGLVVRDYVPLKEVSEGINGLPITKEWRCFFYKDRLLADGYYWSIEEGSENWKLPKEGIEFVQKVANIISRKTNFFVLDIAEKKEGGWILIEVNDGQMSGLSCVDPHELYLNLIGAV